MNKVKSPLVKVLRKAGYSTKEAMIISIKAWRNYKQCRQTTDRRYFNGLVSCGKLDCAFVWHKTKEGHEYWRDVMLALSY